MARFLPPTTGARALLTALAYLTDTVRARPNLEIRDHARALRLVAKNGSIAAAMLERGGKTEAVEADRFVLAAGAIRSPTLLMQSGIGPARHLQESGIAPLLDRPGIGEGLQDHPAVTVSAYLARAGARRARAAAQLYVPALFLRPSALRSQRHGSWLRSNRSAWHAIGCRVATLSTFMGQAFSRGRIRMRNADPMAEPDVCFDHLVDLRDRRRMMDAIRLSAAIFASASVRAVTSDSFRAGLGPNVRSSAFPAGVTV
jgi:5-(hydroxymethyl)furfural/furfural oxidase